MIIAFSPVISGVPRGSVIGPIPFSMYINPFATVNVSLSTIHHSFADNLQLQMSAPPDKISELLHSMQSCINYIKAWAYANMLKLNDNKTEHMLVTSNFTKHLNNLPTRSGGIVVSTLVGRSLRQCFNSHSEH